MSKPDLTIPAQDPSHDFLRSERRPLDAFFRPRNVALVGATDRPGSVGRTVLDNLLRAPFAGGVYPINPKRAEILGKKTYPGVKEVPEALDLAIVVTPAQTVPGVVRDCVDAGVKAVIVISAGFKERGAEGVALEREIAAELRRGETRLIGPNCLGLMNPNVGLNATFAQDTARPGNVAFISQSGALLTAILDWSLRELVGFSGFVSTGSMLDVGWGDLIYYFGDDPNTQSILIYMESIGDARTILTAAREVALTKPIIVIKAGRTEAASKAAASHTGALTGSDEVLDAAFRRCGVLRVNSIGDLFYMAEVLSKQPRPRGPRLAIVSNAGGPAVLATDALISNGGELAALAPETLKKLDEFLPPHWSHGNPVDILGDAEPDRYARALEIVAADANSDGLLVILAPQGMTSPAATAERLAPYAHKYDKPVLASWMGGAGVSAADVILNEAGIPTFAYPDTAARAFEYMWRYTYNLRALYETPVLADDPTAAADYRHQAAAILDAARAEDRSILTEAESKQVLSLYGLPTVETHVAQDEDAAIELAAQLGYPVVVKLHSKTLTHKTDVGGVKLNLTSPDAVRQAFRSIKESVARHAGAQHFDGVAVQRMVKAEGYELIVGSSLDPQFGPVILFGSGGQLVEVYRDRALALPPLNTTLARRLMERTRVLTALKGVRGRLPVDLAALERLLVRFSRLVVEQRSIRELDINPLLASPERLVALDARIVVHPRAVKEDELPQLAIRPYPAQYVAQWKAKDGAGVEIRPVRPEDEPLLVQFHHTLSERSVYLRYFQVASLSFRTAHERLTRICFADFDREMALLALRREPGSADPVLTAVGRLSKLHGAREAEVAVLVSDQYQRRGLGTELLRRLIEVARDEHISRIIANILPENHEMQTVAQRLGFQFRKLPGQNLVQATLDL